MSTLRRNTRKNEAEEFRCRNNRLRSGWQATACSRTLIAKRVIAVSTEQEIQRCGNRIACTSVATRLATRRRGPQPSDVRWPTVGSGVRRRLAVGSRLKGGTAWPEARQGPTKGLWITFFESGFHLRDIINADKIGAAPTLGERGPDLLPHPPTPQEVGADIIQSKLWRSVGAFQFVQNSLGCCDQATYSV